MTDLINEIEKAIEKAKIEHGNRALRMAPWTDLTDADSFNAGAQFILPLLKKAIEQRDYALMFAIDDSEEQRQINEAEMLKLLGGEK